MAAAAALGFTERVRFATDSQVPIRLLIQTGRCLDQLTLADPAEFTVACRWAGICGLNSVRCNNNETSRRVYRTRRAGRSDPPPSPASTLVASGHGIAVLTDKPMFGLAPVAIRVGESLLAVTLYAGWDRTHWAGTQIAMLVDEVSQFHREVLMENTSHS